MLKDTQELRKRRNYGHPHLDLKGGGGSSKEALLEALSGKIKVIRKRSSSVANGLREGEGFRREI